MAKAKKLFLLRERRETWRLRINRRHRREMCPQCKQEVDWLTIDEAELLSSELNVSGFAEAGSVHLGEMESGLLLVCGRSFRAALQK